MSSCNTGEMEERLVAYPIIYRAVHYIPGGCLGFIPSTVSLHKKVTNMDLLHLCFQIFHGGGFLAKHEVLSPMDEFQPIVMISNSQSSDFIFNCFKVLNTQTYFSFWFDTKSKLGQVEKFRPKSLILRWLLHLVLSVLEGDPPPSFSSDSSGKKTISIVKICHPVIGT